MKKIFISHASEDKEAIARPLADALRKAGHVVWLDESDLKAGDSLVQRIENAVNGCDHAIAILSQSYRAKAWTREESDLILRRASPGDERFALPVLHGLSPEEFDKGWSMLANRLGISTAGGLDEVVRRIREAIETSDPEPRASRLPSTPSMAPQPPAHPLHVRQEFLSKLRGLLQTSSAPILLHGLPGIGKTTVAAMLAHDAFLKERFPDGVLWAGLGNRPNIVELLDKWVAALKHLIPPARSSLFKSVRDRQDALREALHGRRMLLVADDAWTAASAQEFNLRVPGCAYLVTTRRPKLVEALSEYGFEKVPELDEEASLKLLAPFELDRYLSRDELSWLVGLTGGLPLALILAGNYLRAQAHGGDKRRLQDALDSLGSIEKLLSLRQAQPPLDGHPGLPNRKHYSLLRIIHLSVRALSDSEARCLGSLAAFPPKPSSFSPESASAVSEAPPKVLYSLSDNGLVEGTGQGRYTLHQTIAGYATRMKLTEPDAHLRMARWFGDMLEPYRKPLTRFAPEERAKVTHEESNIRACLLWCEKQGRWPQFVPLVSAYCNYLTNFSRWQEVIEWGEKAASAASRCQDPYAVAQLHGYTLAWPLWMRGEYARARASCQLAIDAASQLSGDDREMFLCFATHNLHKACLEESQHAPDRSAALELMPDVSRYAEQCFEHAGNVKDAKLSNALLGLAYSDKAYSALKWGRHRYAEAEEYFKKRLELIRQPDGSPARTADGASRLLDLAIAVLGQNRFEEARALYSEAGEIAAELGRADIDAEILFGLARIEKATGHPAAAKEAFLEADRIWRRAGLARDPFVGILDKPVFEPG